MSEQKKESEEERKERLRRERIERDVAESIARTNSTIFGYSWEQIQRMQQRRK